MEKIYINSEQLEWKEANGYPSGTMEDIEPKTFFLKLPKNLHLEAHSHIAIELHFVLEGEYISNDNTYVKGSYRLILIVHLLLKMGLRFWLLEKLGNNL